MRVMGLNVLAIIVAAIAIYAIEFVLFGLLIPADQYMAMSGMTADQVHPERMPLGAVPVILSAIGLALAVKWRNKPGWMGGAMTGLLVAVFLAFPVGLYGYVYGASTETLTAIDLAHFVVCYGVAGAILGAWK